MEKSKEKLVDEGFRISLVETAFFDGKFEIPHIDGPDKIIIPEDIQEDQHCWMNWRRWRRKCNLNEILVF